jgi:hypothetical protein
VGLWTVPLCLSLGVLWLQFTGCATSPDTQTTQANEPASKPAVSPQREKGLETQPAHKTPRQLQQDKKNVVAEAPDSDDVPRKAKKRSDKKLRKPQPSGEIPLPPEPSKPPAIGGSGG